jgi:fructose-bisphosphate aldolase class II
VDLLAISVGTSHGEYELQDEIDYGLIKEVRGITEVPLVMYGTCGVPLTHITKIVTAGMRK